MNYKEKLQDPRWQKKRLEILDRDDFTCQNCKSTTDTLHVHHKYYKSIDPWDYSNDSYITLCDNCHKLEHEFLKNCIKIKDVDNQLVTLHINERGINFTSSNCFTLSSYDMIKIDDFIKNYFKNI